MKKIIGVMPLWDKKRDSIWMLPGYLDGIREAGGLPIIFPLNASQEDIEQLCGLCSGFLLTGGQDVNPALYGEKNLLDSITWSMERDNLDRQVIDYAIKNDLPVLGICRGIQLLNALLGGTLYQDIPTQHGTATEHCMQPPYDRICHEIDIVKGSDLYRLLAAERIGVNSYHHQAVKKLAPDLEAMAMSEDGLVEAVRLKGKKFIWAVQWHPELSYRNDQNSKKIFAEFISNC